MPNFGTFFHFLGAMVHACVTMLIRCPQHSKAGEAAPIGHAHASRELGTPKIDHGSVGYQIRFLVVNEMLLEAKAIPVLAKTEKHHRFGDATFRASIE